MPATKTQRSNPAKATVTRRRATAATRSKTAIDRTTELSDEVLKSVESGQRSAIEAVHKFVDTVDQSLSGGESPSRRQEVVDAALEMADRLVHAQYDFIRKLVDSAGRTLGGPSVEK